MSEDQKCDVTLRRVAWVSLTAAGLSVVGLVGFMYFTIWEHNSQRAKNRVEFEVHLDPSIRSVSKAKILINGVGEYVNDSMDPVKGWILKSHIRDGFRPVGKIDSKIYTINGIATKLDLNFKEGFDSRTKYSVSPTIIECDSQCKDFARAYRELDTLNRKISRLSKLLLVLSPNGNIDTEYVDGLK